MHPLISVVIPVWNRPYFLYLAVNSVLAQTYPHFEVVIVDDGSTDQTVQMAKYLCYLDRRVRLVKEDHVGCTEAFNIGVRASLGEVICIMGSDDLWEPTKLEEQVKVHLCQMTHVLHTESKRIDVNGNPQKDVYKSNLLGELGGIDPESFVRRHCKKPFAGFFASSLFIPAGVFDKVGLFPESVCQDYYWVMQAALIHKVPFTLLPKHLIQNRTNPESTTGTRYQEIIQEAQQIWWTVMEERTALCMK